MKAVNIVVSEEGLGSARVSHDSQLVYECTFAYVGKVLLQTEGFMNVHSPTERVT